MPDRRFVTITLTPEQHALLDRDAGVDNTSIAATVRRIVNGYYGLTGQRIAPGRPATGSPKTARGDP